MVDIFYKNKKVPQRAAGPFYSKKKFIFSQQVQQLLQQERQRQ